MKKTVKACAVVTKRGSIPLYGLRASVNDPVLCVGRTRRELDLITEEGETILPCTITYDLPKKRAKK